MQKRCEGLNENYVFGDLITLPGSLIVKVLRFADLSIISYFALVLPPVMLKKKEEGVER